MQALDIHLRLIESRKLINNFVCQTKLTLPRLGALLSSPERPGVVIVQLDVIISLILQAVTVSLVETDNRFGKNLYF